MFTVLYIAFFFYDHLKRGPIADKYKKDLETEFKQIDQLPDASLKRYEVSAKPGSALVHGSFKTDKRFNEIRSYYDVELKKNGWKFWKIDSVKDWGKDLGGKSIRFCKGSYIATIQYFGEKADYGSTYSFSLSWGLHTCQKNS
ncbi:MAG: hypothetical protein GY699_02420 [Desulfobacteraceae bacterium]|nr:hypothetical protein [Desulfobacteraceae bacterium]